MPFTRGVMLGARQNESRQQIIKFRQGKQFQIQMIIYLLIALLIIKIQSQCCLDFQQNGRCRICPQSTHLFRGSCLMKIRNCQDQEGFQCLSCQFGYKMLQNSTLCMKVPNQTDINNVDLNQSGYKSLPPSNKKIKAFFEAVRQSINGSGSPYIGFEFTGDDYFLYRLIFATKRGFQQVGIAVNDDQFVERERTKIEKEDDEIIVGHFTHQEYYKLVAREIKTRGYKEQDIVDIFKKRNENKYRVVMKNEKQGKIQVIQIVLQYDYKFKPLDVNNLSGLHQHIANELQKTLITIGKAPKGITLIYLHQKPDSYEIAFQKYNTKHIVDFTVNRSSLKVLGTRTEEILLRQIILQEKDFKAVSSVKEKLQIQGNITKAAQGEKQSIVMNYFVVDGNTQFYVLSYSGLENYDILHQFSTSSSKKISQSVVGQQFGMKLLFQAEPELKQATILEFVVNNHFQRALLFFDQVQFIQYTFQIQENVFHFISIIEIDFYQLPYQAFDENPHRTRYLISQRTFSIDHTPEIYASQSNINLFKYVYKNEEVIVIDLFREDQNYRYTLEAFNDNQQDQDGQNSKRKQNQGENSEKGVNQEQENTDGNQNSQQNSQQNNNKTMILDGKNQSGKNQTFNTQMIIVAGKQISQNEILQGMKIFIEKMEQKNEILFSQFAMQENSTNMRVEVKIVKTSPLPVSNKIYTLQYRKADGQMIVLDINETKQSSVQETLETDYPEYFQEASAWSNFPPITIVQKNLPALVVSDDAGIFYQLENYQSTPIIMPLGKKPLFQVSDWTFIHNKIMQLLSWETQNYIFEPINRNGYLGQVNQYGFEIAYPSGRVYMMKVSVLKGLNEIFPVFIRLKDAEVPNFEGSERKAPSEGVINFIRYYFGKRVKVLWQQVQKNFMWAVFRAYEGQGTKLVSIIFNHFTEDIYTVVYLNNGFVHSGKNMQAVKQAFITLKDNLKDYNLGELQLLHAMHRGEHGVYELHLFVQLDEKTLLVKMLKNPEFVQVFQLTDIKSNTQAIREEAKESTSYKLHKTSMEPEFQQAQRLLFATYGHYLRGVKIATIETLYEGSDIIYNVIYKTRSGYWKAVLIYNYNSETARIRGLNQHRVTTEIPSAADHCQEYQNSMCKVCAKGYYLDSTKLCISHILGCEVQAGDKCLKCGDQFPILEMYHCF